MAFQFDFEKELEKPLFMEKDLEKKECNPKKNKMETLFSLERY